MWTVTLILFICAIVATLFAAAGKMSPWWAVGILWVLFLLQVLPVGRM